MKMHFFFSSLIAIGFLLPGCVQQKPTEGFSSKHIESHLDMDAVNAVAAKFAPVDISYDQSILSADDKKALLELARASLIMDEIFQEQAYSWNGVLAEELAAGGKEAEPLKTLFNIMVGPFDRLADDAPFINLDREKPLGANYYPEDMTREEFEAYVAANPEQEAELTGTFSLVRRDGDGLKAVPYSEAYSNKLAKAAKHLRNAAEFTTNESLKTYLTSRAASFESNDYYQSDMDWMDLTDHTIEVVIGPYEVYEDRMFSYKGAFTSFLTIVDPVDSKKLQTIDQYLDDLERRLPIDDKYKNFNRGGSSPVVSVQVVMTAGDTKAGVQTAAFNLPNDERVREAKGSKKVMLKNVTQAKYNNCSVPIMDRILNKADLKKVSFEAFFYHILLHEMCHGIGPGKIVKDGKETTVNKELKETYSTLEELKADIVGLYHFPYMIEKGVFDAKLAESVYPSFVGGIFRSVRFGTTSAHGGGNVMILNYLQEKGGIEYDKVEGRFGVNYDKIQPAIEALSREVLMIQAEGNYTAAKAFIAKYRSETPELRAALEKLEDVPVDIKPHYTVLDEL
ncbi:MAG: dipeptidyl-peptidase 3 family protein [Calditrichia bacterium]